MELYVLDEDKYYQPDTIVEGYSSLIWTERYLPAGDFTLVSSQVDNMRKKLALGSLITLADTREVMIVEQHEIKKDNSGQTNITVTGRTLETFYENRTTLVNPESINDSGGDANDITIENHSSSYSALLTLNRAKSSLVDATNAIPYFSNSDVTTKKLALKDRTIARADAYSEVLKILAEDDLGLRNDRPHVDEKVHVLYIYNGVDRSATIMLDEESDHFSEISYLFSIKGYKTAVYSSSARYFTRATRAGTSTFTGFDRRVGLLDNTDITKTGTKYLNATKTRGKTYLGKNKKTTILDAKAAMNIPYRFNKHYFMGDILMCLGKYGINQKLRVTEYVRTQDATGESGYPTLSALGGDYDD
jgi:hypothetical protein